MIGIYRSLELYSICFCDLYDLEAIVLLINDISLYIRALMSLSRHLQCFLLYDRHLQESKDFWSEYSFLLYLSANPLSRDEIAFLLFLFCCIISAAIIARLVMCCYNSKAYIRPLQGLRTLLNLFSCCIYKTRTLLNLFSCC